jgi:hypothetical protein
MKGKRTGEKKEGREKQEVRGRYRGSGRRKQKLSVEGCVRKNKNYEPKTLS